MSSQAKISSLELAEQLEDRYVDQIFEVALVQAPGTSYQPGITTDGAFMANEVVQGTAGYARQTIGFQQADISSYTDGGVGLATKGAVFAHDGSGTSYQFTHVVLLRGGGNVLGLNTPQARPTAAVNGQYLALPTIAVDEGVGLTVDVAVVNNGLSATDFTITVNTPGTGYETGDAVSISSAVLTAAGVTSTPSGSLDFTIGPVTEGAGNIVSVSPTSSTVTLTGGNEAVFYFNVKHFGFN